MQKFRYFMVTGDGPAWVSQHKQIEENYTGWRHFRYDLAEKFGSNMGNRKEEYASLSVNNGQK